MQPPPLRGPLALRPIVSTLSLPNRIEVNVDPVDVNVDPMDVNIDCIDVNMRCMLVISTAC
jgi:hypothetical protein